MSYRNSYEFTALHCYVSSYEYNSYWRVTVTNCTKLKDGFQFHYDSHLWPSVLWHCWLDGRKGIRPVKTEWWVAGVVICLEWGADLHMSQLMPLPLTVSCFSKIQIGFTFLVLAYLGSPRQRAVKRVCVCVCNNQKAQCVKTGRKYSFKRGIIGLHFGENYPLPI